MNTTPLMVTINDHKQTLNCRPCPFCGSQLLRVTEWWSDDGEFDAISCSHCEAEAPAKTWNNRGGESHGS